jgi:hypothetical protein
MPKLLKVFLLPPLLLYCNIPLLAQPNFQFNFSPSVVNYANPASNHVNVNYNFDEHAIFNLYNAIELKSIPNGFYHYELEFTNNLKSTGKIRIIN